LFVFNRRGGRVAECGGLL